MTVHLLHAPDGTRHSFVPKKVVNFPLENLRSALHHHGADTRVWNGHRSGRVTEDSLRAALEPGDWLVCPLIEGTAAATTLGLAVRAASAAGAKSVATSHLATFASQEILETFPGLDHVILGEDEELLPHLVSDPAALRPRILRAAPVPSHKWCYPAGATWGAYGILESSRGCAHNCTFCSVNSFADERRRPRWRCVDAQVAQSWISQHADAGVRLLEFIDADFLGTNEPGLARAGALAATAPPGLSMMLATRADSVTRNPALIEALTAWGVRRFQIGVESADRQALARYRKSLLPTTSVAALALLRAMDAQVRLEFIMFEPDSTLASLRANFELLCQFHEQAIGIQRALFNRMRIGRWSPSMIHDLSRQGRLRRHIFPLYDYRDVNPDVAWVFESLQRAHDRSVGEAITLSLLVERLRDLGAVSAPSTSHLMTLDAHLLAYFGSLLDARERGEEGYPADAAAGLQGSCATWVAATDRLLAAMPASSISLLPTLRERLANAPAPDSAAMER